jgi:hypothetical protein
MCSNCELGDVKLIVFRFIYSVLHLGQLLRGLGEHEEEEKELENSEVKGVHF